MAKSKKKVGLRGAARYMANVESRGLNKATAAVKKNVAARSKRSSNVRTVLSKARSY